ncbi:MAG: hypothetical protein ACTSPY_11685 [Candidatus Helarchaeota archaeon]
MESQEEDTISALIASYESPNDKITLLARAIDMLMANFGAIEINITNLHNAVTQNSNYLRSLADAVMKMNTELKRIATKMGDVENVIQNKVEAGIEKLKETYKPVAARVRTVATPADNYTPGPPTSAPAQPVQEPSLLKPSQIKGGGGGAPSTGGMGMPMGGMSPRMAMMAEIKRKMGGSGGGGAGGGGGGELGGGYVPKIQQPRKAKPISKNLSKTMNKLLETKFQKQIGGNIPPAVKSGGPPRAPPRGPPQAIHGSSQKDKKTKKKEKEKKKDKSKSSTSPQLRALEDKIKNKFG